MASSRMNASISRAVFAAFVTIAIADKTAFASQGPGTSAGTASSLTQSAMTIIVYGTSALVVGAGLIGALRKQ